MKTYLSWRDVLDGDKSEYGYMSEAIKIAIKIGYKAILWNGCVWHEPTPGGEWIQTDQTIEDIK